MYYISDEELDRRRARFRFLSEAEIARLQCEDAARQKQRERLKGVKPAPPLWISMHIPTERERRARVLFDSEVNE